MKIELDPNEERVIGCLIEKQITTPDQYPLSLNALTNACNQKSNRDPMLNLDEATVQRTLDGLSKKHLIVERSGFGSRVPKYQHRFCNTEFGTLKFSEQELAIICELLLRGPQTPGELKTRAARMAPSITDVSQIDEALTTLSTRDDGPFVVRLTRQPGRRDSQWAHLFGTTPPANIDSATAAAREDREPNSAPFTAAHTTASTHLTPSLSTPISTSAPASKGPSYDERISKLESDVESLRSELDALRQLIAPRS